MDRAAVIGHPVNKSLSPKIFKVMAKAYGREVSYRKIDVRAGELRSFFKGRDGFIGWNVTIPHKEEILKLVARLTPEVKAIGAANVVHFETARGVAHNTDVFGIRQTLREQGVRLRGREAVLYGAGGAARAVAYALVGEGARRVWVVNRTRSRGEALCRYFNSRATKFVYVKSADAIPSKIALMVNATPAGDSFTFPRGVDARTLAFDLVYRRQFTPFLKMARRHGIRTVNGLTMLIWQAIATWEIWFGKVKGRPALKEKIWRCVT